VALSDRLKGWYTNWVNGYQYDPQNWEDFHLAQLVPWIDANLRTMADRSGRAIAGLSMGGFGSIHYAEDRPDLFSYAASFSGALDLGNQYTESAIYGEETGMVPGSGPAVPPGAIFGPEYWPSNQHEVDLSDVNPANVAHLRTPRWPPRWRRPESTTGTARTTSPRRPSAGAATTTTTSSAGTPTSRMTCRE